MSAIHEDGIRFVREADDAIVNWLILLWKLNFYFYLLKVSLL